MSRANPRQEYRRVDRGFNSKLLSENDADTLYIAISGGDDPVVFTLPSIRITGQRFGFMRATQNIRVNDNNSTIEMPWGAELGDIKSSLSGSVINLVWEGLRWRVTYATGEWLDVADTHIHRYDGNVPGGTLNNFVAVGVDGTIKDSGSASGTFAAATHASQHENTGGDEINVAGLSGQLADQQLPIQHALDNTAYHSSPGSPVEDHFFLANSNGLPKDAGFGLDSMWQPVPVSFSRSSDSVISITTGAKADAIFKDRKGRPIRFRATAGTWRYAIATAYDDAGGDLIIAGAPFTISDDDELEFSDMSRVHYVDFSIPGLFADAADTALIANDLNAYFSWRLGKSYLVRIVHRVKTDDSGASQPRVNASVGGNAVSTSNSNAGRDVAEAWTSTVVDINTTNYEVNFDDAIELSTDANGTNNDAADLSVSLTMVLE